MQETTIFVKAGTVLVVMASVLLFGCTRVELDNPENGTFTTDTSLAVDGHVFSLHPTDPTIDVADLTLKVNGAPVPLGADGTFTTSVLLDPDRIFNAIEADILSVSTGRVDSDRVVVIVGESIEEGSFSPEAMALQINASGLAALEPVVSSLVDLDVATLMPENTVVIENTCLINGPNNCLGAATISITSPTPAVSSFGVDFGADQDRVNAVISLHDFDINLHIDGGPWVLIPNCDLNLKASTVSLSGAFALEPDAINPSKVDVTQIDSISTLFVDFDQTFTSGACSSFLVGDIITAIMGDVEPMVRSGLEGFLNGVDANGNSVIAAAIEGALSGVDISGPIGQALSARLDAPLFKVEETVSGITLGADARFVTSIGSAPGECSPPDGAPDLSASFHVTQPFPDFEPITTYGLPYDIGLGISTSGFNQLLRSMVECGLLIATISEIDVLGTGTPLPLTSGLLGVFIPELLEFGPNQPARIEISPTLAPLITGASGPGGELALLKIAQLKLKIIVTAENGIPVDAVDFMLDADVGIDLDLDPVTGALVFDLAEPAPQNITVKTVETPIGADLSDVEMLLPHLVGSFLPSLASGLGSFPLPSFLGLSLDVIEVSRTGELLTIYANLDSGELEECIAEAGIQYYDVVNGNVGYGGNLYNPALIGGEFDGLLVSQVAAEHIMGTRRNADSELVFHGVNGASFYDDNDGSYLGAFNPTLSGGEFDGRPISALGSHEILGVNQSAHWELVLIGAQGLAYYDVVSGAYRWSTNPTLSGGDYDGSTISAVPPTMFVGTRDASNSELVFMGPSGINYYDDNGSLHRILDPIMVGGKFASRKLSSLDPRTEIAGIMNIVGAGLGLFISEDAATCENSGKTGLQYYDVVTGAVAYRGGITDPVLAGGEFNGVRVSALAADSIMGTRRNGDSELVLLGGQGASFYDDNSGNFFGAWNPTLSGGEFNGRAISDLQPDEILGVNMSANWELVLVGVDGLAYYDVVSGDHRVAGNPNPRLSGGDFDGIMLGQLPRDAFLGTRDNPNSELVFMGPSGINYYDDNGTLHRILNPILVGGEFSARRVSSLRQDEVAGIMNVVGGGLVLRKAQ